MFPINGFLFTNLIRLRAFYVSPFYKILFNQLYPNCWFNACS